MPRKSGAAGEKEEDESMYNIQETNESFSERKHQTNIPALKNNRNQLNNRKNKAFSARLFDPNSGTKIDPTDPLQVGTQMIIEINLIAGQLLQLWHKLIELVQIAPRFTTELLHTEYEEKMRDRWTESIFRDVVGTQDFALPSEENVGETHKKMAKTRRANNVYSSTEGLAVSSLS